MRKGRCIAASTQYSCIGALGERHSAPTNTSEARRRAAGRYKDEGASCPRRRLRYNRLHVRPMRHRVDACQRRASARRRHRMPSMRGVQRDRYAAQRGPLRRDKLHMSDDFKRYRRYAEECRRLADKFGSIKDKATLLNLAQAWEQLADQAGEDGPKRDRN
jgi:hypothetical protein